MRNSLFAFSVSLGLVSVLVSTTALAAPNFSAPNNSTVAACADFATETYNDPWDFSDDEDLPRALKPRQYQNTSEPAFSNGIMSFFATSSDPYFSLTTTDDLNASIPLPLNQRFGANDPIDVSRYKRVTFRMRTDVSSNYQIFWKGVSSDANFAITNPVSTFANNYRVYSLDLTSIGLNQVGTGATTWAGENKRQFRIDPSSAAGANIFFDWVMLTPDDASCPNITSSFTETTGLAALTVIDDNTNFADGYHNFSVNATTGTSQDVTFPVSRLFPGTYNVYGFSSADYASLFGDPWDFGQSTDIEQSNSITGATVSGGAFSGTTSGSGANFYVKTDGDKPINASIFKRLTVRMNVAASGAGLAYVYWFDANGTLKGSTESAPMQINQGDNTLTWDLSTFTGWSGDVADLRINPDIRSGTGFSVSYVALTTGSVATTDPVAATQSAAPGTATINSPATVQFIQPDDHGGRDCPTHDYNNPWVMDSTADVAQSSNILTPQIFPYNSIQDSRGIARIGDYYTGVTPPASTSGFDDPKVFPISFTTPLNADRCVNTCYGMVLNLSPEVFHSVARLTYQANGVNQDGDDVVNPDTWGASEICVRMNTLKQEPDLAPGTTHPWRGTIDFFSLDPMEETENTRFYIDYIELREDHKANTQFLLSADAALTATVDFYVSGTKPTSKRALPSGAVKVGSLTPGRNSNAFVWNTTAVANGTYYVSAQVDPAGLNPLIAHAVLPVVVDHASTQNTTAPTLIVDSPAAGYQATTSVQVAGAAFDDIQLGVIEVLIDGTHYDSFTPTLHHKATREQFRNSAPNNPGFNFALDIGNLANGAHTLTYNVYDTAGNLTTQAIPFTKGGSATPDVTYPNADAAPINFPAATFGLTVAVTESKNVGFALTGYDNCVSTTITGSRTSDFSTSSPMLVQRGGSPKSAVDVPQYIGAASLHDLLFAKKDTKAQKCNKAFKTCNTTCNSKFPGAKNKKKKAACKVKCTTKKNKCLGVVPTPTPTPIPEDGKLYFRAQCQSDTSTRSNIVELNAGTQITNPGNTTGFETDILRAVQTKLNS